MSGAHRETVSEHEREALDLLLESPPTFRDYTGGDWKCCGYCHEPIEDPRFGHAHRDDCVWDRARRLARPTPATRTPD